MKFFTKWLENAVTRKSADSCLSLSMLEIIFLQDYFYKKRDLVIGLPHPESERSISRTEKKRTVARRRCTAGARTHPQSNFFFRSAGLSSPRYTCRKCDRGYTMLCNLRRHMKWECGGKRFFPCYYCSKSFTQKTSLQRHLTGVHNIDADIANGIKSNFM